MIVAIDGPSGAGKSSVSQNVAKKLRFLCLDTGSMFRAIAWLAEKQNIDFFDENSLENLALNHKIRFEHDPGNPAYRDIYIDEYKITDQIRTDKINKAVTPVCKHAAVRSALLEQQREIASKNNYVIEGRDIGTVVFPNAELKIFLVADVEERAKRRQEQNIQTGVGTTNYNEVLADLKRRDHEDSTRAVAPLKAADDAKIVDSTSMTQDEVVDCIVNMVKEIKN